MREKKWPGPKFIYIYIYIYTYIYIQNRNSLSPKVLDNEPELIHKLWASDGPALPRILARFRACALGLRA